MEFVSNSAINESAKAVELSFSLLGSMCLWSGLLNIAKKSGLTKKIAKFLAPIVKLIFNKIDTTSYLFELICMNITANMLGLGNAATPIGIKAMQEMQKSENANGNIASNNMVIFVLLNTASVSIIPTTVATLRLKAGSATPLDILPAVWITSITALIFAITLAKTISGFNKHKKHQQNAPKK
ncbi:MAG: nucleoside recognition domain-containing protein [Oscillospiraceae bacterium]